MSVRGAQWSRQQRLQAAAAWSVVGVALWGLLLAPVLLLLGDELLGIPHFDAHGTWWFYWYTERVLLDGASVLHTDLFFYPWGKDIYGDTGANMLDAVLAVPFRVALGPVAGFNLFALLGMLLSGLAIGWLARALTADPVGVGAAAALGSVTPFALVELVEGRPTQALLVLPALALGSMLRLAERRSLGLAIGGGLALALCGYQYWFYGVFLGMAGLVLVVCCVAAGPDRWALVRQTGLLLGIALLLVLPGALPMLRSASDGAVTGMFDPAEWGLAWQRFVTVDGSEVALYLWQPLRGAAGFMHQHGGGQEVFLGTARYTPIATALAAGVGLWRLRRGPRARVLLLGLLAVLLATGPVILVADLILPNPPYLLLVHVVPVFQRLWWPGRAYVLLAMLGPALVAVAVAAAGRWRWLATLAIVVGVAAQLVHDDLAPVETWRPDPPAAVSCLAEGPPGALISLPDAYAQEQLLHQSVHGRPTLGGMNIMLTPPQSQALQADNSFVAALLRLAAASGPFQPAIDVADRQAALDLGFRYVAISWEAYDLPGTGGGRLQPDEARRNVRRGLLNVLGQPVWDDPRMTLWDLRGQGSPCEGSGLLPDTERVSRSELPSRLPLDLDQKDQRLRRLGQRAPRGGGQPHREKRSHGASPGG